MPANQGSASTGSSTKCAHAACKCMVKAGQRYCSDYCDSTAKANKPAVSKCGCGHPPCAGGR
ncbi:MAG: hypothetical protein E6H60_09185 [Betaproteobacteria bacterium]|nr:MAG: hypothetical protein E6H64_04410 [Betaproteobacteria bacterium]TMH49979.1 MAG: hypothetical protein E6H60_09185 [Betaproteobacteria bacterium]TMI00953.1 MAG: hypothetical protein E6H46_12100 [Betaproteobacteria bacterium]